MSGLSFPVRCTRCRNEHGHAARVSKPRKVKPGGIAMSDLVCPACGCKSFYDITPQVAWCWASGLIEVGDQPPADSPQGGGAIVIARGPKYALKLQIAAVARHGQGESAGHLLVPGVPEAQGQKAKGDALAAFLAWCNKRKPKDGVVFAKEYT